MFIASLVMDLIKVNLEKYFLRLFILVLVHHFRLAGLHIQVGNKYYKDKIIYNNMIPSSIFTNIATGFINDSTTCIVR